MFIAVRNGRVKGDASSIEKLAAAIKAKLKEGENILVVTAPLERTLKTANMIGEQLGIDPADIRKIDALLSEKYENGSIMVEAILKEANNGHYDVVISVGLNEGPAGIIDLIASNYRSETVTSEKKAIEYGTGVFFDPLSNGRGSLP